MTKSQVTATKTYTSLVEVYFVVLQKKVKCSTPSLITDRIARACVYVKGCVCVKSLNPVGGGGCC